MVDKQDKDIDTALQSDMHVACATHFHLKQQIEMPCTMHLNCFSKN
jgi:hypothetical protein